MELLRFRVVLEHVAVLLATEAPPVVGAPLEVKGTPRVPDGKGPPAFRIVRRLPRLTGALFGWLNLMRSKQTWGPQGRRALGSEWQQARPPSRCICYFAATKDHSKSPLSPPNRKGPQ